MTPPPAWYLLLAVVAICGVAAWYLRTFTERVATLRLVAIVGSCCMASLAIWTLQLQA